MTENAFLPADIFLPADTDMTKWSVIACDQFSSERAYWDRIEKTIGDCPSTLRLIVPEAYLDEINTAQSAKMIGGRMKSYLDDGLFRTIENSYIYIERTISDGRVRRGLVGKIDLEKYDYSPGSTASVRASEGTIISRLPARIEVRRAAPLELPHIMALIDDRACRVIEPLAERISRLEKVYDFTLLEGGGSIKGWRVTGEDLNEITEALCCLTAQSPVQMIIGDGNHSLAAAKGYWDEIKSGLSAQDKISHPARYALVEINNVYDPAISFEAIHRVIFEAAPEALLDKLKKELGSTAGSGYKLRWLTSSTAGEIHISAGSIGELIGKLQAFLDDYVKSAGCRIDYIHGDKSVELLTKTEGSVGFLLPTMDKSDFFKTVLAGGVFPKKSFSIGHARDKRYYLECRAIG